MDDMVLTALTQRRAELIVEAKAAEAAKRRLLADIEHIDGAIRTYNAAYRPRKVEISRGKRVELARGALGILREATAPMTLRELAAAILARAGHDPRDSKLVASRMNRLRTALNRQRANGAVRSLTGDGQLLLWEVTK